LLFPPFSIDRAGSGASLCDDPARSHKEQAIYRELVESKEAIVRDFPFRRLVKITRRMGAKAEWKA
jgi:hypothetical protein